MGAEAAEIQLGVVLDPAQRDLGGLAVADLGFGVGGAGLVVVRGRSQTREDVLGFFLEQALDERKVVRGGGGSAIGSRKCSPSDPTARRCGRVRAQRVEHLFHLVDAIRS